MLDKFQFNIFTKLFQFSCAYLSFMVYILHLYTYLSSIRKTYFEINFKIKILDVSLAREGNRGCRFFVKQGNSVCTRTREYVRLNDMNLNRNQRSTSETAVYGRTTRISFISCAMRSGRASFKNARAIIMNASRPYTTSDFSFCTRKRMIKNSKLFPSFLTSQCITLSFKS